MPSHSPTRRAQGPRRSTSRSRSPYRPPKGPTSHRPRSRSPDHHDNGRHKRKRSPPKAVALPFSAGPLSKRDFDGYKAVFALYLDIQKQLVLDDLDEHEMKGRWKSFTGKWNRGELAEGWYDPATKAKAGQPASGAPRATYSSKRRRRDSPERDRSPTRGPPAGDSDEDDEFGPVLPRSDGTSRRPGPTVPTLQDLELRNELAAEDSANHLADLRYSRKADRKEQKERLEELVPRADPGSRERQLEKKRETTATMRTFREAKSPGAEEVGEGDLMGDDGIDGYKARKKEAERKKNEREVRKEEIWRARAAEREEKLAEHRAKEEKTMEMLKALAKQRFG